MIRYPVELFPSLGGLLRNVDHQPSMRFNKARFASFSLFDQST